MIITKHTQRDYNNTIANVCMHGASYRIHAYIQVAALL